MPVRTKPSRQEIAAAENLYRDFRERQADGHGLHKGLVVRTGLMTLRSFFQTASVRERVYLFTAASAVWESHAGVMLRRLSGDVGEQISSIQNASSEIPQGNADLSRRAEAAAMSVQETASATTGMTMRCRTMLTRRGRPISCPLGRAMLR